MSSESQKKLKHWALLCSDLSFGKKLQSLATRYHFQVTLLTKDSLIHDFDQTDIDIFCVIMTQWPIDLPPFSNKIFTLWLATENLPQDPARLRPLDFALSLNEFENHVAWHISQIHKLCDLKVYGTYNQQWRETILEKFKVKAKVLETMNARLQKLSITDDLTGIYNHRFFIQIFGDECNRSLRYQHSLSLLMIDVDYFKSINDNFGHLVGDRVLFSIAQELKKCVRRVDSVCRYGGEEFAIILPMTGLRPAQELAERIRARIAKLFPQKNLPLKSMSVSIGVTTFPDHGNNPEALFKAADEALYRAKSLGRNRVETYQAASQR